MKRRRAVVTAQVAALVLAAAGPSAASDFDPASAEESVKEALHGDAYSFCRKPPVPLSPRAEKLCPLARDIPDCAALVAACAGDEKKADALPRLPSGPFGPIVSALAHGGMWLLVLAVLAALAFPLLSALARARKDRAFAEPVGDEPVVAREAPAPLEDTELLTDAERLYAHAAELSRKGELDRALFAYLQASLRALDERGAIRIERHRTHGEYVRACKEEGARAPLRAIVREVERVRFGGDRPSTEAVSRAAAHAAALVRAAALVALAVLALAGCGQIVKPGLGADPADDGLLVDLLRRQGVSVSRLGGSLATLPMAKPEDLPPVVVVDVERTPLEDETRAHLLRWIEAGGILVLAGEPASWPKELSATQLHATSLEVRVTSRAEESAEGESEEEHPRERVDKGNLARSDALSWAPDDATIVATLGSGQTYAALRHREKGELLGIANADLLTNAGLARPGNAAAAIALLGHVDQGGEWRVASPEDGISPPTNPVSSLVRAGLGKGLLHALLATGLLFFAAGVRQARPRQAPASARRAFAEHVEATGALYAHRHLGAHALVVYTRYADDRLRAKMPRGTSDVAAFLAARAGADPATCARIWARATEPNPFGGAAQGDELRVLGELSLLVTAATRTE